MFKSNEKFTVTYAMTHFLSVSKQLEREAQYS